MLVLGFFLVAFVFPPSACWVMALPSQPITLSPEQIDELHKKLSLMRHDINNTLSLISAAVELIQFKPHMADRMMATLQEQPPKITAYIQQFSSEFERIFGKRTN